jgi:hypothetical protein
MFGSAAYIIFPLAFLIAAGHVFLLGIPAYLALRRLNRIAWPSVLLGGFLLGCIPMALWFLVAGADQAGWYRDLSGIALLYGSLGVIAGALFHIIVRRGGTGQMDPGPRQSGQTRV